ncbi:hypothetical protein R1flu_010573 [Riccia fluitans]|uniref:non-specific serine/threonine protein kinase n=1 Tax=Riccia fluitans TaxID=41844 RepID=A0ABD1Z5C6_9MARC
MGAMRYLLLVISIVCLLKSSSAQPGFISIDCGTSGNYTDPATGITWTGDDGFISTGSSVANLPTAMQLQENKKQMSSLRFFDDSRSKHCYVLPVGASGTYLVRAMFLYANYDKEATNPIFDLAIDATLWRTIDFTLDRDVTNSWFKPTVVEVLVPVENSNISVCLIRTSSAYTPFISSLELRSITGSSYSYVTKSQSILENVGRFNCGPAANSSLVRFPDDSFDRIWVPSDQNSGLQTMSSGGPVAPSDNMPPSVVLQSGWISDGGFSFYWHSLPPASLYYAAFYFADLTGSKDTRIMDISLNGKLWYADVNATAFGNSALSVSTEVVAMGIANFSFAKSSGSSLGPILNAAELYAVLSVMNETTYRPDVDVLNILQARFNLRGWSSDPCSPVPWNWISCSSAAPPRVTGLKLSGVNITGALPDEVLQLTMLADLFMDHNMLISIPEDFTPLVNLERLHLQNNRLTGSVPDSFQKLRQLKELFLDNNYFNGTLPEQLMNTSTFMITAYANPFLCIPYQYVCGGENTDHTKLIIICSAGAAGSVLLVALLIFCCRRRRKLRPLNLTNRLGSGYFGTAYEMYNSDGSTTPVHPVMGTSGGGAPFIPRVDVPKFTYEEIKTATDNFRVQTGEGVIGPIYQGTLANGKHVAVITLSSKSTLTHDEFTTEVAILSKIQHKNLVCLVGYCDEPHRRVLVFEYMAKGTIRDHLYGKLTASEPVNWKQRLEIALNAARGLQFLHTQCAPRIIHGDVKSSNIFLNEDLAAKVAEFGLAKLREDITATSGFMISEFSTGEKLTTKSDVFNFGIVLLECICGRKTAKTEGAIENMNIIQWVKSSLQDGNIHAIIDPALAKNYNVEAMWHVAELALLSTDGRAVSRPTMTQVVRALAEAIEIESGTFVAIQPSTNSSVVTLKDGKDRERDGRSQRKRSSRRHVDRAHRPMKLVNIHLSPHRFAGKLDTATQRISLCD